jgi:hypothetical protein
MMSGFDTSFVFLRNFLVSGHLCSYLCMVGCCHFLLVNLGRSMRTVRTNL